MILFLISVGLTVTMGLMRIVNLAHGAFAMIGGYVAGYLTQNGGNFYLAAIAAAAAAGVLGGIAEATIYRPLYRKGELAQVLLTIGIAVCDDRGDHGNLRRLPLPCRVPGLPDPADRHRLSRLPGLPAVPDRGRRGHRRGAVAGPGRLDLRRSAARGRRQSAHGARRRHRREPAVHRYLHRRLRTGRARRCDRRRRPLARTGLCT